MGISTSARRDDGLDARLGAIADEHAILAVIYRYCRGIDRRDYELVRSCYHADAVDDHGEFVGGVDEFIDYVRRGITAFERTMHFIGNVLVEVSDDTARAESYIVAYHHLPAGRTKPERDFTVWLRYVDDFARRNGEWRIAKRVCVFEWGRIDPIGAATWLPDARAARGHTDGSDLLYAGQLQR
jgi:hypothetical protein